MNRIKRRNRAICLLWSVREVAEGITIGGGELAADNIGRSVGVAAEVHVVRPVAVRAVFNDQIKTAVQQNTSAIAIDRVTFNPCARN